MLSAPVWPRKTREKADFHPMTRNRILCPVTWLAMLGSLGLASAVQAATATVILSQDCEYILMDSSQGQILAKIVKGEPPKSGDTLEGPLQQRSFSEMTVQRTSAQINLWIDQVDRSGTKALMRYSQYCN